MLKTLQCCITRLVFVIYSRSLPEPVASRLIILYLSNLLGKEPWSNQPLAKQKVILSSLPQLIIWMRLNYRLYMLVQIQYCLELSQVLVNIFMRFWLFFLGEMYLQYQYSMLFLIRHPNYGVVGMLRRVYGPFEFFQFWISQKLMLLTCSQFRLL